MAILTPMGGPPALALPLPLPGHSPCAPLSPVPIRPTLFFTSFGFEMSIKHHRQPLIASFQHQQQQSNQDCRLHGWSLHRPPGGGHCPWSRGLRDGQFGRRNWLVEIKRHVRISSELLSQRAARSQSACDEARIQHNLLR